MIETRTSSFSGRLALSIVLALLLWPALVHPVYPPETHLDASWQEVLVRAHAQGWQFGRDLIFTWGPWGFLQSQYHLGDEAATTKLIWEVVGKLLVAAGAIALTHRLAAWRQVLFCGLALVFAWLFLDSIYLVLIALAVLGALLRATTPRWQLMLWIAALAFLGQMKFTYNLLAFGGVFCAAGADALRRDFRRAAGLLGGYVLAFVLFWIAAGQNPDNLVPYFRLSWEISQGYATAMAVNETWPVFWCGAGLMACVALFVSQLFCRRENRPFAIGAAAFLAGAWFVVWKHGFTRADGHVQGFFLFTLMLAPVVPALCQPDRRWHWFGLTPVLCLLGIHLADAGLPLRCPGIAWSIERENTFWLLHSGAAPARWRKSFDATHATNPLPEITRVVGSSTVDVFNYDQGVALIPRLNYTPRPVFQSYSAYSPRLMGHNLRFYQSPRAPDFVLWKYITIDWRFPTLDDAMVLVELARGYRPVLSEGDFLLLRKNTPLPARRLERKFLESFTPALGETVALPAARDQAVWLRTEFPLSRLGRLRAFFYKPPVMHAIVTDDGGREINYRVTPLVAEDGFLVGPFLETPDDFAAFLRGRARQWLRSIRFEPESGEEEFWGRPLVQFFALPQMKMANDAPFRQLLAEGIVDRPPESFRSPSPLEYFSIASDRAAQFHAPAELVLPVSPTATQFSGRFGLRDGAYDGGGRTDGVDFVIEGRWPDGRTEVLWRRYLDPRLTAADRGPQTVTVALPAVRPSQLALRTLPGPKDDNQWDWSYWSHLRFAPFSAP